VNAQGQVVGWSNSELGGRAFSWTAAGGMVDLGTLGAGLSRAVAVNDSGMVVGWRGWEAYPGGEFAVAWPIANFGCHGTLAGCNLSGVILPGAYLTGISAEP
jgi:probable HAF family extracellular repeat protein